MMKMMKIQIKYEKSREQSLQKKKNNKLAIYQETTKIYWDMLIKFLKKWMNR